MKLVHRVLRHAPLAVCVHTSTLVRYAREGTDTYTVCCIARQARCIVRKMDTFAGRLCTFCIVAAMIGQRIRDDRG